MEDKRFDSLTKSLASGASRRSVLKGLLGFGAAAVTGAVVQGDDVADAARRPTPTPVPHKCPGVQTWNGTKCVCPAGLSQCVPGGGPACCNDQAVAPGAPGYSTCCDNACCQGTCTSEEICCSTNRRAGGLPPTNRVCAVAGSSRCCLYSDECCTIDGCCSTTCFGGSDGRSFCCAGDDWCPGGSTSLERCCQGDSVCCGANTNGNVCAHLSNDNNNCGACGHKCSGCSTCRNGVCVADNSKCTGEGQVCCQKSDSFICETGPYCGCDVDSDCPGTNPAACQVGWCDHGTCKIKAATNTTVCHPAGLGPNATCDPAVLCNGADQFCPGPHYAAPGTDCGNCMSCNATGVCSARCTEGQDCCPATDKCVPHGATCCTSDTQCTTPCQTCNEDLGYCVSICITGQSCCTKGDGPECCSTAAGFACCDVSGCVSTMTDNNNCGQCGHICPGCSTCQNGLCSATNSKCTGEGQVCCKNGDSYTCEAGPYCGCDSDRDCSNLDNSATCQIGKCDHSGAFSICVTAPAPVTTICHPAGPNATCDPAVMCSGADQSCPGPQYAPSQTVCGTCLECNGQGLCLATCVEGQQCCHFRQPVGDVCIPNGETCCDSEGACPQDCEICNYSLHFCVSNCDPASEQCCPGTDNCVPAAATCCGNDSNCSALDNCDGLIWHNYSCGVDGYCVDAPVDCNDGDLCTTDSCDAATGCSYTPVICNSPLPCFTAPGFCDPEDGLCNYLPLVCDINACQQCLNGSCTDICPIGTHCNGAGLCIPDCIPGGSCEVDSDCCGNHLCCNSVCVTPDSACGQCLSTCGNNASKCCCFHPENGNYDCANRTGCDNGQGHFCVN